MAQAMTSLWRLSLLQNKSADFVLINDKASCWIG